MRGARLTPQELLSRAIALAVENVRQGRGGPFGAVVARAGEIVAEGTNQVTAIDDPTAHAEIVAIRAACRALGSFQLAGCEIYASCEPCPMCLGAIYWARPDRLWFAATRADAAHAGFDDSLIYDEIAMPLSQRHIPTARLAHDHAIRPFDEWRSRQDRVPY